MELPNNKAERAVKSLVMGRKNCLMKTVQIQAIWRLICQGKKKYKITVNKIYGKKRKAWLYDVYGDCKIVCVRMNDSLNLFL
nr:hypothetical protein [Lactobacillus crispatus]